MKRLPYLIATFVFFIDQITKTFILQNFSYLESKVIIPNFFSITYVKNTGGAFSIFSDNVFLFVIIGICAFITLIFYMNRQGLLDFGNSLVWGSIIGGLLGNLIDRIIHKGVIDFIDFTFGSYHYPVFNIADIAIVLGVVGMIILEVRGMNCENRT